MTPKQIKAILDTMDYEAKTVRSIEYPDLPGWMSLSARQVMDLVAAVEENCAHRLAEALIRMSKKES